MNDSLDRLMGDASNAAASSEETTDERPAPSHDGYPDTPEYTQGESYDEEAWPSDVGRRHRRAREDQARKNRTREDARKQSRGRPARRRKEPEPDDTRKKQFVIRADQDRALNRELASENYEYGQDRSEVIRTLLDEAGFCD